MEIHTVTEYIEAIEKLRKNYTYEITAGMPALSGRKNVISPKFIFRGHSNHEKYQLIPGIFRWRKLPDGSEVTEYSQMEYNILMDFTSEGCRYIKDIPTDNNVAWLEIAQHFGVPTRLLDFTENPLVALFFACCSLSPADASVWVINEAYYNQMCYAIPALPALNTSQLIEDIVSWEIMHDHRPPADHVPYTKFPIIYRPARREERMSTQSSVFMLWSVLQLPLSSILSPKNYMSFDTIPEEPQNGLIAPIIIKGSAKKTIISQLDDLGLDEKFIYPGLDGIGRYIRSKYSSKGMLAIAIE